ncbi:MAG: sulfite exporter TauE/SafE family protein, partial [Planctomycetaceae bacterium]|nr:sulfite exporter TauE/SafE family protein [Planctomycetaceae bacterium]
GLPLPLWRRIQSGFLADLVVHFTRSLTRSRSPFAPLVLGLVNGLLPCPLVYVMLAAAFVSAARFEGLWASLSLSLGFALGTMPIMVSIGTFGAAVSAGSRRNLLRFAAVLMVIMGVITVARGIPYFEPYLHFGHSGPGHH